MEDRIYAAVEAMETERGKHRRVNTFKSKLQKLYNSDESFFERCTFP